MQVSYVMETIIFLLYTPWQHTSLHIQKLKNFWSLTQHNNTAAKGNSQTWINYSSVIGASCNSIPAWIETNAVDVWFMTFKDLNTLASSHIPYHDGLITALGKQSRCNTVRIVYCRFSNNAHQQFQLASKLSHDMSIHISTTITTTVQTSI